MNAIKFIKEHGVEKAREVVDGAPEWASHFDGYLYSEKQFHEQCFLLSDLKRLVEDIDLLVEHSLSGCWGIDDIYGIEGTGMYLNGYAFYSNSEEKAELDRLQLALDRTVKAFGGEHV